VLSSRRCGVVSHTIEMFAFENLFLNWSG
jgi:hypothetical protein